MLERYRQIAVGSGQVDPDGSTCLLTDFDSVSHLIPIEFLPFGAHDDNRY